MHKRVRKAVFPVAGLGTRFLPATKAMPKEMLPVVDKPLIHYAVEEAKAAGIEQFFFVTGRAKGAIDDHFDRAFELEATLRERGKNDARRRARSAAARARPDRLYPPADAARPRPRGVVRARSGRRRALRRAAGRRSDGLRASRASPRWSRPMTRSAAIWPRSSKCRASRPGAMACSTSSPMTAGWCGPGASSKSPSRPMRRRPQRSSAATSSSPRCSGISSTPRPAAAAKSS